MYVSDISAVVKVVDSHLCGWGSIPGSFPIVSFSKSLSQLFMCSDQHVKYRIIHGFPLTSSLLLDYHIKQYIHTTNKVSIIYICIRPCITQQLQPLCKFAICFSSTHAVSLNLPVQFERKILQDLNHPLGCTLLLVDPKENIHSENIS